MTNRHSFMLMPTLAVAAVAVFTFAGGQAVASNLQPVSSTADAVAMTEGEVRKVDRETKKITLRHGPILNLGMPAMAMVFQVSDPAMLEQVKAGDQVMFTAEKTGGVYVVTHIRKKNINGVPPTTASPPP